MGRKWGVPVDQAVGAPFFLSERPRSGAERGSRKPSVLIFAIMRHFLGSVIYITHQCGVCQTESRLGLELCENSGLVAVTYDHENDHARPVILAGR